MNSYIILKWGSLKAYHFSDKFLEKNKTICEEFVNVWNEIYKNHCSATGGSEEVQKNKELKSKMLNVLEKLYNLGIPFENGFTDEYYNSFEDIKEYIVNYGG